MQDKVRKKVNQTPMHTDAAVLLVLCAQIAHLSRMGRAYPTLGCPLDLDTLRTEAGRVRAAFERFEVCVKVRGEHDSVELGAKHSYLELAFRAEGKTGKLNATQLKQLLPVQLLLALVDELNSRQNVSSDFDRVNISTVLSGFIDPPEQPAEGEEWRNLEFRRGLDCIGDQLRQELVTTLTRELVEILRNLHRIAQEPQCVEHGESRAVSELGAHGENVEAAAKRLAENHRLVLCWGMGAGITGALILRAHQPMQSKEKVPDIRLVLEEGRPGIFQELRQFVARARTYLTSKGVHGMGYVAHALNRTSKDRLLAAFKPRYEKPLCDHVTESVNVLERSPLPPNANSVEVIGYTTDGQGVEALVVAVNGSERRPDGGTYHITLSIAADRQPRETNDVIEQHGWIPLAETIPVQTNIAWKPFSG